jgi:hypothetical protein
LEKVGEIMSNLIRKLNISADKSNYHHQKRKTSAYGSREYIDHRTKEKYHLFKGKKLRGEPKYKNKTNRELYLLAEKDTQAVLKQNRDLENNPNVIKVGSKEWNEYMGIK